MSQPIKLNVLLGNFNKENKNMRYYEEELEVLIKAGAKVVEVASFEWERVHGFAKRI